MSSLTNRSLQKADKRNPVILRIAGKLSHSVLYMLFGAVIGFLLNQLIFLSPFFSPLPDGGSESMEWMLSIQGALAACLLFPMIEELVFRKWLFGNIRNMTGTVFAAVISSFIFAVFHGTAANGVYAFLMGLIFCFSYDKKDDLLDPLSLHAGANAAAWIIMAVSI